MRFGWTLHAGPFWLSDTLWRSKRRRAGRPAWHGTHDALPGWVCPHFHTRPDTAQACGTREARRRGAI